MMIERIIKVVLEILVEQRSEDFVHKALEARRSIRKSEGHNAESERAKWSHESGFPFVTGSDADLVVTGFQVELRKDFRSADAVHHLVDTRQRITVFDRDIVEFVVIDDWSTGSILFPNEEHRGGDRTVRIRGFSPTGIEHLIEDFSAFSMFFLVHMIWSAWLGERFRRVEVDCEVGIRSEIGESSGGFLSVESIHIVVVILRDIRGDGLKAFRNVDCIEFDLLGGERI